MSRPLCRKDTFFAARFLVIPFTKGHENPNQLYKLGKNCILPTFFYIDTVTKVLANWFAIAVVPKAPLEAVEATDRSPVQVRLKKPQRKPRRRIRKTNGTRTTRSLHIPTCKNYFF